MKKLIRNIIPISSLFLFGFALWFLHHQLKAFHYHDMIRHIQSLSPRAVGLAILFTALSYVTLIGYDALAFRYVGRTLEFSKVALTSFISYSFSNSIGHSLLTGGSVRYRLYSSWDVSGEDISKIVAFCTLTFWVGVFSLGGVLFLSQPLVVPTSSFAHFVPPKSIGILFSLAIAAYFCLIVLQKNNSVEFLGWAWPVPSLPVGASQVVISSLDWAISAAVLYSLLPVEGRVGFVLFLGIYMLAQVFALISQVPAGLGVFESLIILLLSPYQPGSEVLGALLIYRGIYCLLPLGIASVLFGVREFLQTREGLKKWLGVVGGIIPRVAPTLFSAGVFFSGTVLLISGATPAVPQRLHFLEDILPLGVIEFSHFAGSLAGAGLLLLARGLQRRLDAAYHLTGILLALGIGASLLKGLDFEEATILTLMLITLWSCRENFYRKTVLMSESFTPWWVVAIAMVLAGSIWLGFFAHKHVDYSNELWWHFSLKGDAPRFMRASVGAIGVIIIFMVMTLLKPSPPEPAHPSAADMESAKSIFEKVPNTYPNLALLGDKNFLFNESRTAFLMYGIQGRSWVAMGDPVGPENERTELVWKFREMSDEHDGWTVFYEVGRENLPLYVDLGLTLIKLGEEAHVPLADFSLDGGARKSLRYLNNQMEKKECTFELRPKESVMELMPELKAVSDEWLSEKSTKEKGFSLGFFNESYLMNFPIAVIRQSGKIVAFANLWETPNKEEISIDLMRYSTEAPAGVMEYLFVKLMLWGAENGYKQFNLGMAPLSGLENRALAPLWSKVGSFVFRYGENFYNFEGLRQYKEKFHPVWEPKYMAVPSGFHLPGIFANVSTLISGGIKGLLAK